VPDPTHQDREQTPDKNSAGALSKKDAPPAVHRDIGSLKDSGTGLPSDPPSDHHRLLLAQLAGPARAAERADLLRSLQRSHGNQYVQRLSAAASPDRPDAAIGQASPVGAGRPLDKPVRD